MILGVAQTALTSIVLTFTTIATASSCCCTAQDRATAHGN